MSARGDAGTPCQGAPPPELLDLIERDVSERLAHRPERLAHSLSVARTAERLALAYGVDPLCARAAGLLHDWDKALPKAEQLALARELGIDMGVDLELVQPLLHGITASLILPARYPQLPSEVWRAIRLHTTASADMTPLDEVVFVADGIEPLRPPGEGIGHVRALVGVVGLDELFWESFRGGIAHVIRGGRYLYPGTIDVYNALCLARSGQPKRRP